MDKVPTNLEELTEKQILEIAKEVSTYSKGMPLTKEKWHKIQIVAAYVFNKQNIPS